MSQNTPQEGSKSARVDGTRGRIIQAVIDSLDAHGYAATSINRVQDAAGVSRGALTHHFPSKEAMMVATIIALLEPVRARREKLPPADSFRDELIRLWDRVINTREGRALFELLAAARTDIALRDKITPHLATYNTDVNANLRSLYGFEAHHPELEALWSMCRAFLRGLHVQQHFDPDPKTTRALIESFADLVAPRLQSVLDAS